MPESDLRIYIGELRASQKAQEEAQRVGQASQLETNAQLASVAKELHGLSKVFAGQSVKVDRIESLIDKHDERLRTVEDVVAEDRPAKRNKEWATRAFIVLLVSALFYLVFPK